MQKSKFKSNYPLDSAIFLDKIKKLFSKKVNIGNNGSQNIDTITDENPSEDESNEE